jgi:hypothetical protein
MYTSSIIMLVSWPVVIFLSWLLVSVALRFFEKSQEKTAKKLEKEL